MFRASLRVVSGENDTEKAKRHLHLGLLAKAVGKMMNMEESK